MKGDREFVGKLVGFDIYVNMVLQVRELLPRGSAEKPAVRAVACMNMWSVDCWSRSGRCFAQDVTEIERTPEGVALSKASQRPCRATTHQRVLQQSCKHFCLGLLVDGTRLAPCSQLDQILLNGNSVAMMVPGGKPDDVDI